MFVFISSRIKDGAFILVYNIVFAQKFSRCISVLFFFFNIIFLPHVECVYSCIRCIISHSSSNRIAALAIAIAPSNVRFPPQKPEL